MDMAELMNDVGVTIFYYSSKVAHMSTMEIEDARQELMITAWQSSEKYERIKPDMDRSKFIKVSIYYRSLRLMTQAQRRYNKDNNPLMWPLFRAHSPNHADRIIEKMYIAQVLSTLTDKQKEIVVLRLAGYTQREIGNMINYSRPEVTRLLKKVKINVAKKRFQV